MTIKITIRECKLMNAKSWTSHCTTDDVSIAIRRTIGRHFGKSRGFYVDRGLTTNPETTRYGQIGHQLSPSLSTMDTGRVRIDIERI